MFFNSSTIDHLVEDHDKIREHMDVLLDQKQDDGSKKLAFVKMLPMLISHSHREEKVVYSYMAKQSEELKRLAIEGDEEHAILDGLVEELQDYTLPDDEWIAKSKVFADLLCHHFDLEEREVFPKLKKVLNDEADEQLCFEYDGRRSYERPTYQSSLFYTLLSF
ncbi:MAG: hemerythrin domain-containing protein [Bdellovibrionales bacterium]|nr:hemerythrin domain-containing protein [Bdellovibrionales bacterium]